MMRFAVLPLVFLSSCMLVSCTSEQRTSDPAEAEGEAVEGADQASLLVLDPTVGEGGTAVDSAGVDDVFDPECLITEDGVANLGMPATLGEFADSFPARTVLTFYPNYMVDFGALCVRSGGEDAICAVFESYGVESYAGGIETIGFAVLSDKCETAEGVGPGSPVAEVAAAYGVATFGFNYDNEGREYVSFADAPEGYSFRAESTAGEEGESDATRPPGRHGGDYSGVNGDGGYYETDRAQPDAVLWEVWVPRPR